MRRCQHCGSQVDQGAVYCSHCGGAVAGENSARDDTRRDQPPAEPGARVRTERSGDERRQQQDSRRGGPEHHRQETSGVGRQTLLVGGGGLLALGAGGWYLFLRDTSPDDPMGVLDRSWETWEDGDFEAYDELVHSDSPMRAEEWWEMMATGEEEFGLADGVEWTLEEREQVEKTNDRAAIARSASGPRSSLP